MHIPFDHTRRMLATLPSNSKQKKRRRFEFHIWYDVTSNDKKTKYCVRALIILAINVMEQITITIIVITIIKGISSNAASKGLSEFPSIVNLIKKSRKEFKYHNYYMLR